MPRTRAQLEQAAADAEAWLDQLDPAIATVEDPADLRRVGLALRHVADAEHALEEAVTDARHNGRSWAMIATVLGTSKQAAQKRYERAPLEAPNIENVTAAPAARGSGRRVAPKGKRKRVVRNP
jgi:Tfp pilus assembly protein PilF